MRRITSLLCAAAVTSFLSPARGFAQDSTRLGWAIPGSPEESELRFAQTIGLLPGSSWNIRAVTTDGTVRPTGRGWTPAWLTGWYNTTYPFGMNDGPAWAGRGLTLQGSAGAWLAWGPFEVTLSPTAFWAENRGFPLMLTPDSTSVYGDPLEGKGIDRPQRFGPKSYARLDPGRSSVSVRQWRLVAGVSTASHWWGPMAEYPFILGSNAAGFPHLFAGSASPLRTPLGAVHGRVLYGRLAQSAFSPVPADSNHRFVGGMIGAFEPRWIPGLEIGVARFYHLDWPDQLTAGHFTHLFETILKGRIGRVQDRAPGDPGLSSTDNQLASLFARWTFPAGIEVYGEYGREDHSATVYDLLVEPDHSAALGFGARKAWRTGERLRGLQVEMINYQPSSLLRHRAESGAYPHVYLRQGHTHLGQLLGTGVAAGAGAGAIMSLSEFTPRGWTQLSLARLIVRDTDIVPPTAQLVARAARSHRRSAGVEVHYAVDGVLELNRHFNADQGNLRLELGLIWRP